MTTSDPLRAFSPAARSWFTQAFAAPTDAQTGAWEAAASGEHALVLAPTGSGKTLAAFLWAVDRLLTGPQPPAERRLRVVYVSPLKALAADVERNLTSPLVGIGAAAARSGTQVNDVRTAVRTGDTPAKDRRAMIAHPPDILITTPESLYLMLTSQARAVFAGVETVVLDEVHAVAGTKRGAHLALSLERLDEIVDTPVQRIGLSATVEPPAVVADFLVGHRTLEDGGRPVRIVDAGGRPRLEITLVSPVADFTDPLATPTRESERAARHQAELARLAGTPGGDATVADGPDAATAPSGDDGADATSFDAAWTPPSTQPSVWPALTDRVVDLVETHRSTIVFTHGRRTAEKLTARINAEWQARAQDTAPRERTAAEGMPAQVMGQSDVVPARAPDVEVPVRAHHGSMSRQERTRTEEDLKAGRLRAVVATSSLELGIDMGAVDLVIQVGAPPSVASALQRVGRAGHQVGATSHSVWLPLHRGEIAPALVVAELAAAGRIEPLHPTVNPLDVLAQQIVAIVAMDDSTVADVATLVRRSAPFHTLSDDALHGVLDLLSGRYPSEDFADLRPRLIWDRTDDTLRARPGAQRLAVTSGGTIPDRGMYGVFLAGPGDAARAAGAAERGADVGPAGDDVTAGTRGVGRRVGELDEEMVHESRVGDVFTLGTSSWRIEAITPDRVLVSPAPGLASRLPFWRGDGAGRPVSLGRAIGERLRTVDTDADTADEHTAADEPRGGAPGSSSPADRRVVVDPAATANLRTYLAEQEAATGVLPDDRTIVLERFRDEVGDWRMVLHSTLGGRVLAPWSLVIGHRLSARAGMNVQVMAADDGIVWRMPDTIAAHDGDGGAAVPVAPDPFAPVRADSLDGASPRDALLRDGSGQGPALDVADLLLDPGEVSRHVVDALAGSAHLASRFREAAARSLLLPRRNPSRRQPLWQQRHRAAQLFSVASGHEDFPVLVEAVRESLVDDYDVPALTALMAALADGSVRLVEVTTAQPSPFARSLLMGYTANFLYDEDAPAAERRASALALSPALLAELIGSDLGDLADLLDADAVAEVSAEVALATDATRSHDAEGVFDHVRRLGPLPVADLAARGTEPGQVAEQVEELIATRRVMVVRVAGVDQVAVVEDAARLRDALGTALPPGLPLAVLEPVADPLGDLVRRHARTHGVFTAEEIAQRLGLGIGAVRPTVDALVREGTFTRGRIAPGATEDTQLVDGEVLRRMRRRSLARLRAEVEAVPPAALATHLARWQDVAAADARPALRGADGALTVLDRLAGTVLPSRAWESLTLPARVRDVTPATLDELCASGEIVWVGAGTQAGGDGLVALLPRETVADLAPPVSAVDLGDTHRALLGRLADGGARFFTDLLPDQGVDPLTGHPVPGASPREVEDALWDLVWAGIVTNDTLAPLRAWRAGGHRRGGTGAGGSATAGGGARPRARGRTSAVRRAALAAAVGAGRHAAGVSPATGGRWSLVDPARVPAPVGSGPGAGTVPPTSPTPDAAAVRAVQVLDMHGVLLRGIPGVEEVPGGFGAAYGIMRRLEEAGQVRRGYLVEGLGGAQFALPEVVDRLRAQAGQLAARADLARSAAADAPLVHLLGATDPAQPYGAAVAWPAPTDAQAATPARAHGAVTVLVDGVPALYLARGGKHLTTFPDTAAHLSRALPAVAAAARAGRISSGARAGLLLERIDGTAALSAPRPLLEALREVGFVPVPSGLRLRAEVSGARG